EINRKVGEKGVVLNRANLEFTIEKANKKNDLIKKAAILLHDIVVSHIFLDGNKRTAFVSTATVLEANGKRFDITDADALGLVYGIANGKYNIADVENIISKCVK
ncbi:MAG: Fic family protein, partial [Candidatus Micrarchaeota archaeon]|nr:Fic family protein [Candidatus Micrarchaeota archaeon]